MILAKTICNFRYVYFEVVLLKETHVFDKGRNVGDSFVKMIGYYCLQVRKGHDAYYIQKSKNRYANTFNALQIAHEESRKTIYS